MKTLLLSIALAFSVGQTVFAADANHSESAVKAAPMVASTYFEFGALLDRDLVAIKKTRTGTNSTEIHILDAQSGYQQFNLQTGTALHETGTNFAFGVLPNSDIVAIKKSDTGTRSTEIHILNARTGYRSFNLQTGTALHETGDNFDFAVLPNRDVMAIKKSQTGTGSTEVHILDAGSNYRRFKLQTGTALHETGSNFVFNVLANGDIMAVKKSMTGTNTTEVYVLSASSGYRRFNQQTGTALHETAD
ncbi:hypothetical protein HNQ59_003346 [Chitinivorax tropicus]|uniref:Alginate biosynthesis protein AlgF n=1 Tax=Chitinivorax tropicus TaxID=714531 RepID=A0A840MN17_9PROT|nr:hypothetical protein [Chitinivorax tropicus]MBB5020038.1 hypothetical protein [Chitinivorax tropicus]